MQHSATKEQSTKSAPTPEEIRKLAFEIHIERGGIYGCDLDDWLKAERELQEKCSHRRRSECTGQFIVTTHPHEATSRCDNSACGQEVRRQK